MSLSLPAGANLVQLRTQAKDLLREYRSGVPAARDRVRQQIPRIAAGDSESVLRLADAQLVVAREYGFASWPRLKKHVDSLAAAGQLKEAINRNDLHQVRKLIEDNRPLLKAAIGYGGGGPLTWAAECRGPATPPTHERLAIARFLLESGADIHEGGDGPLMRACLNEGRLPMVELLYAAGADINAYWAGFYPILCAPCETLAPLVIAWLLDHGADPNPRGGKNRDEGTPLDMVIGTYARSLRQHECAELLIQAGATSRFDGFPSMDIHRGRNDLLAARIEADPGLVDHRFPEFDYGGTGHAALTLKGSTLLHVAASYGAVDAARVLMDAGADPNAPALVDEAGVGGQTPLFHTTAQYHDFGVPVARLLIESGADVTVRARVPGRNDEPDESLEVTPLGFAARFPPDSFPCGAADLLMEHGAPAGDVFAAAKLGLVEELRELLATGADPNMQNLDGETALHAARARGHEEVCRLLTDAGAVEAA